VIGVKGEQAMLFRLQDANVPNGKVSTVDSANKRLYDSSVSRGKVVGVTIKFDPGFFRSGIYGQVAVLAVQSDASEKQYDSYDKMIKVVGATRVWNWPANKFETTIPMRNWHVDEEVINESVDTRWSVLIGLKIVKRDPAVEDSDEVLKISAHWLLDCPKPI